MIQTVATGQLARLDDPYFRHASCSTPAGLMPNVVAVSRGLHPGLLCSTPSGWFCDYSRAGLAMTARSTGIHAAGPSRWLCDYSRTGLAMTAQLTGIHAAGPSRWLCGYSRAGLAMTAPSTGIHAAGPSRWLCECSRSTGLRLTTLKGSHRRAQGANPGRAAVRLGFNPEGVEQAQAISI